MRGPSSAPICLAVLLAGCEVAGVISLDAPRDADSGEHDARFVGQWIVDEPWRATYTGTRYRFEDGGRLIAEASFPEASEAEPDPPGQVGLVCRGCPGRPDDEGCCQQDEPTCTFGRWWKDEGPGVLVIEGRCSDGRVRSMRLDFDAPAAWDHEPGQSIDVLSVDEEVGWIHASRQWRFSKCPARALGRYCGSD